MDATLRQRIAATVLCVVLSGAAAGAAVAQTPDPELLKQLPQLGPTPPAAVTPPPQTTTTTPPPPPQTTTTETSPPTRTRTTPARTFTTSQATELPNTGTQPSTVATLGLALMAAGFGLRLRARKV